ncbi:MAG: metal-dependent hydrolase [Candidatus Thorarchaeota archaeon]|nr:metal-dependent hydrolase [Candidatus Thorarchaeota archaeon]
MHGSWKPIGLFGKYLFYKPMTWLLGKKSDAFHEEHRGYLHSLIGCFLASLFFAIPIAIIFIITAFVLMSSLDLTILIWYLWLGLPFGFLMHLAEDSFTKSGVRWFFPRGRAYSGQTSTGRKSEYNLLTTFLILFGLFSVFVWIQIATIELLIISIVGSIVLLGILYGINPIISRLSQ